MTAQSQPRTRTHGGGSNRAEETTTTEVAVPAASKTGVRRRGVRSPGLREQPTDSDSRPAVSGGQLQITTTRLVAGPHARAHAKPGHSPAHAYRGNERDTTHGPSSEARAGARGQGRSHLELPYFFLGLLLPSPPSAAWILIFSSWAGRQNGRTGIRNTTDGAQHYQHPAKPPRLQNR